MSSREPRVFVVNRSAHDYQDARRYGELVYVTTGRQRYYTVNNHARLWMEALKDSQPHDYIILSSLNILCSIGCALFAMLHGHLNFLLYHKGKYVERTLDLKDMLDAENIDPRWANRLYLHTMEELESTDGTSSE